METKIWMNGRIIEWDECKIHPINYSLHYGVGVFEGIRFYETEKGTAIFRLKDHIKRLLNSAKTVSMQIAYSEEELVKAVKEIVAANDIKSGYLRPIVFYGDSKLSLHAKNDVINVVIAVLPWGKYLSNDSVKVMSSSYMRHHPKSLPMTAKITGYYVNSVLAVLEARKNGYDEALLLDYNGNVAEGPGENFFIVKGKALATPPLGNVLPGITRDCIIKIASDEGIEVYEKDFNLDEAKKADEAFFTGTAAEVTPISHLDKSAIGNGTVGPTTAKLKNMYRDIVTGKNEKYEKWLDYVI